jgi:hypothetical protein
MENRKIEPHGSYYLFAVLVLVVGCLIAAAVFCGGIQSLGTRAAEQMGGEMMQVIMPGSVEVELSESGPYTAIYSPVVQGQVYSTEGQYPTLICTLVSAATGASVPIAPPSMPGTYPYPYEAQEAAAGILEFTIDEPGTYTLSCALLEEEPGPAAEPEFIMTIWQGAFIEEFYGLAGEMSRAMLGGLAVLIGSIAAAVAIAVVITVKREQSKKGPKEQPEPRDSALLMPTDYEENGGPGSKTGRTDS